MKWDLIDGCSAQEGREQLSNLRDIVRDDFSTILDEEELGIGVVSSSSKLQRRSVRERSRVLRRRRVAVS